MTTIAAAREWARGQLPLEAAVELLIRSGFITDTCGLVDGRGCVDFEHLAFMEPVCPRSLRGVLDVALSLVDVDYPVALGDVLPGLDRADVALVAAAISHAAGCHVYGDTRIVDGQLKMSTPAALVEWPA